MYIGQKDGNQIALMIEGYQHPDASQNYFEANWLMVTLSVCTPEAAWQAKAPAILASELNRFIDWLQALEDNRAENRFFDFEDPMLYICLQDRTAHIITLEFHLHLDFRCPQEQNHETRIAVTLEFAQLDAWIRELKQFAEAYPVRYVFEIL
jgi:hypothetical protein